MITVVPCASPSPGSEAPSRLGWWAQSVGGACGVRNRGNVPRPAVENASQWGGEAGFEQDMFWEPDSNSQCREGRAVKAGILKRRAEQHRTGPTHVLLAGGSVSEWASFTDDQWRARLDDLLEIAQGAKARFVTVHPHETMRSSAQFGFDRDGVDSTRALRREVTRDGIRIVVDPVVDGRDRIVQAVASWPRGRRLTEKRLSSALFGGAGEPDLVVVLGSDDLLPTSLVWELAYGELVFLDVHWAELDVGRLRVAIDEFARRQRRFGGIE